jgi:hypothetical protein
MNDGPEQPNKEHYGERYFERSGLSLGEKGMQVERLIAFLGGKGGGFFHAALLFSSAK